MDFRGKRKVIINGREKSMLFYEGKLIWSKLYGEFAKDFKSLKEDENFEGKYNPQKGALMLSDEYLRLPPIIEIEGEKSIKIEYGGTFNLPTVKAYTVSGETLTPSLEIYRDGARVEKLDTKKSGKYELRYSAEIGGKRSQVSYFVEVEEPKVPNLIDMTTYRKWGTVNITQNGNEYVISRPTNNAGPWGLVSGETMTLENGVKYTLYAEISTRDLSKLTYNYIISANGNQGINTINLTTDGQYHKYLVEIKPTANRGKAGILIGGDKRKVNGDEFKIRNIALYEGDYPYDF